jgi:hypothetical protein
VNEFEVLLGAFAGNKVDTRTALTRQLCHR